MSQWQKYGGDFVLFVESGFIAASQTDEEAALKLFEAAQLLNPQASLPVIGFGYIHFLKLELAKASQKFASVLESDPSNEMARALLGLTTAFTQKGVEKGKKLLEEAMNRTEEVSVKNMALAGIEFVETFVEKAPTPVQGSMKNSKKSPKPKKSPQ